MLAKLQEKGISSYDKAAKGLKDMNEELYFYTPRHRIAVKGRPTLSSWGCTVTYASLADTISRPECFCGWPSSRRSTSSSVEYMFFYEYRRPAEGISAAFCEEEGGRFDQYPVRYARIFPPVILQPH
jgi:hypothetical protein